MPSERNYSHVGWLDDLQGCIRKDEERSPEKFEGSELLTARWLCQNIASTDFCNQCLSYT